MIISLVRTTKYSFQNFWRNLWLSIITVFILMLTLFAVSMVASLNLLADQAIQAIEDKIDIDIFFKDTATEDDIISAQIYLEEIAEVKQVRYVSKDEALASFRESHEDDSDITEALDELSDNPLPASLVVQAEALTDYAFIVQQFETSEYDALVEDKDFSDHQVVINRLSGLLTRVYQGGLAVSAVFVVISIIMMFNTIRVGIYSHREELAIMKLVGATNLFIRGPFVLEGILYAMVASVCAMALLWVVVISSAPYVNDFFQGYNFSLDFFFYSNLWFIFAIQFLFSLVLAVGSSMISIGRYLKV